MSRSYKREPFYKGHNSGKVGKKLAQHKVRKANLPAGKSCKYKHIFSSYDIHDNIQRSSKREATEDYYRKKIQNPEIVEDYETVDDYLNKEWSKPFRRK